MSLPSPSRESASTAYRSPLRRKTELALLRREQGAVLAIDLVTDDLPRIVTLTNAPCPTGNDRLAVRCRDPWARIDSASSEHGACR
jgi:hypothetical protein